MLYSARRLDTQSSFPFFPFLTEVVHLLNFGVHNHDFCHFNLSIPFVVAVQVLGFARRTEEGNWTFSPTAQKTIAEYLKK